MTRSKFSLAILPILILASALSQSPARPPVPIEPLLRNSDPRLVALGAWEVLRRQDDSFIPLMQELVERWDPAQRRDSDPDQLAAMTVILDVLILRNSTVSVAGVSAIVNDFPDQALIFAARLPFLDAEPLLLTWYKDGEAVSRINLDDDGSRRLMLARVAAMMLAKGHPQTVAASLLADSVERLVVSVPSRGSPGVDRCLEGCAAGPACADEPEDASRVGWPPVYQYTLEENMLLPTYRLDPILNGLLLIQAGGDHITYRRVKAEVHLNYCHAPAPLNTANRHHLLAEMLHITDPQMPWSVQQNATLGWVNDPQFLSDLGALVKQEEARLRETVHTFYASGLLSKTKAQTIRPRLSIVVFDDRAPAQPPNTELPQLPIADSRTTYRISRQP
jgi:hypothetical protein